VRLKHSNQDNAATPVADTSIANIFRKDFSHLPRTMDIACKAV